MTVWPAVAVSPPLRVSSSRSRATRSSLKCCATTRWRWIFVFEGLCSMCQGHDCFCSLLNVTVILLNVFTYVSFGLPPQASATEQKVVVVSVSPQSRASLAARYDLSSTEAGSRLTSFFKGLGECKSHLQPKVTQEDEHERLI